MAVVKRLLLLHRQGGAAVRDGSRCTCARASAVQLSICDTPNTGTGKQREARQGQAAQHKQTAVGERRHPYTHFLVVPCCPVAY